jgi:hypothetical protein
MVDGAKKFTRFFCRLCLRKCTLGQDELWRLALALPIFWWRIFRRQL